MTQSKDKLRSAQEPQPSRMHWYMCIIDDGNGTDRQCEVMARTPALAAEAFAIGLASGSGDQVIGSVSVVGADGESWDNPKRFSVRTYVKWMADVGEVPSSTGDEI